MGSYGDNIGHLVRAVKGLLAESKFDEAFEQCLVFTFLWSPVMVERRRRSYLSNVLLASCLVGQKNYWGALQQYKEAIVLDRSQLRAWQGIEMIFDKFGINMKSEAPIFRQTFNKMMEFYKDDEKEKQEKGLKYLCKFKVLDDQRGIFLASACLLMSTNFLNQEEETKHIISVDFLRACDVIEIGLENGILNDTLQRTCKFLMNSKLSKTETIEMAWKYFFISMIKCTDEHLLWRMLTEQCPLPLCTFNAERVLLMYVETYEVHDMVEVLKYKNSLAPSNPVLKLFNTLEQKNHEVAIKEISQVLKARSHIIIGYVRLCKLYNLIKEYEESIKAAQKGMKLMKENTAIYHISYKDMVGLFHIELNIGKLLANGKYDTPELIVPQKNSTASASNSANTKSTTKTEASATAGNLTTQTEINLQTDLISVTQPKTTPKTNLDSATQTKENSSELFTSATQTEKDSTMMLDSATQTEKDSKT